MCEAFDVHNLPIQNCLHQLHIFRKARGISSSDDSIQNSAETDKISFFQNEPIPLSSSLVDDLTTLASTVYIISFIIVIFILLAWITHYNAPCSSLITSILSTITGLPEPIIHSVALCGSCCVWCEKTWLFRRIHQFNIWMSNKIKQFLSGTCKVLYDTICPCCRPPDTPSNRSLIGSLPANIIAMIRVSDISILSPPRPTVTVLEPTPISINASLPLSMTSPKTNTIVNEIYETKSTRTKTLKQPRKQNIRKQRSEIEEPSHIFEESSYELPLDENQFQ